MKQFYFLKTIATLVFILMLSTSFGQQNYRTRNTSGNNNWTTASNWEVETTPGSWSTASQYPGQTANNAATVTIRNMTSGGEYRINASIPNAIGNLVVGVAGTNSAVLRFRNNGTVNLDVNGNISVADGALNVSDQSGGNTHNLSIGGNLTVASGSSFDMTDGDDECNVTFDGSNHTITGPGTFTFFDLTFSNTGTVTVNNNIADIDGTMSVGSNAVIQPAAASVFNSGGAAGTISGSGTIHVTRTAATPDYNNQFDFDTDDLDQLTVEYAGAGNQTINAYTYGNLITSGSGTKTIASDFTVNGNVTIGSGTTLTAPAGGSDDITINGNWINNGTFNGGDDVVTFDGGNQSITGNTTFFNLTKTTNTPETLTFAAGSTQNVTGTLTLTGTAGNLLTLASSSPGTSWNINPSGSRTFDYVSVSHSTNTNATDITATNSFNGGNNIKWLFPAGAATQIALNAGNGQSVTAGSAVPVLPSVLVTDINGTPVSGLTVTFAVTGGGGSITGASAVTNGSGIAAVGSWTLGTTAGTNTLTATRAGLTGSPVTFTATGTVGPLTNFLVEAAGGGNIGTQTANVAFNIRITARDANGNTVTSFTGAGNTVGITSTGTLSNGGGTTATFTNGVLSSHSVTMGSAGTVTITATRTSGGAQVGTSNSYTVNPQTKTSTGDTDWNLPSTWSPAGVPNAGDAVIIRAGDIVTVNSSPASAVFSITFDNNSTNTSGLAFSNNAILTVNGSIIVENDDNADRNITSTISGAGTLNCASLQIGGVFSALSSDRTTVLTSTISNLNIAGDLSIYGEDDGNDNNDATFNLASGTVTVGGSVYTDEENGSVCTFNMNTGAETGTLILTGSVPFNDQVGTLGFDATGTGATVEYAGAAQTVRSTTYTNLTLSGSGTKTTTGVTVNGILSMEGTATVSTAPTYGGSATLRYNTATARTAGAEWLNTFAATGGVIIANTGTITLNAAKVFNNNAPLTINSGASLTSNNLQVSFGGDYNNDGGTFNAGNSPIIISGTATTQSIDGFSTTGTVSMTKGSGTATLQGNVNGGALTINGGGTLNLGTSLTHTFTGTWTRTNGTLNGGSSTLRLAAGFSGTGGAFTANNGTVEWNGANQTVAAVTYNNLILSGSGTKTLAGLSTINNHFTLSGTASATAAAALNIGGDVTIGSGATFNASTFTHLIAGNWVNNGTFTAGTSTINFDGVTQSIGGSNSTTFNNLILSNSGAKTFGVAHNVSGVLNVSTGVVVNLGAFTSTANRLTMGGVDRASGSWGSTTSSATWTNNTFFAATTGIVNVTTCAGGLWTGAVSNDWLDPANWCGGVPVAGTNVVINPVSNQPQINATGAVANNITINSGASLTVGAAGTLSINGAFTNNGTFTANTTSAVNYAQASGTQTILAANYGNLTLSGVGTKAFPTGTVGIAGSFTPGSFATATQGTIDFNGAVAQTIPAFNYFNLTSSNTGARTLASSGTIGIAGAFTPGSNVYTTTGSTIRFNGGTQTIPVFDYNNLTRAGSSGTSVATISGDITVNGDLSITSGRLLFNSSSFVRNVTVTGNYLQSGGEADLASGGATTNLYLGGNLTVSGSGILESSTNNTSVSNGTIYFTSNSSVQTINFSTPGNVDYVNYFVNNGTKVKLSSNISLNRNDVALWKSQFVIQSGGTLDAGTHTISSTGSGGNSIFTLNDGANLETAASSGITAANATINTSNLDFNLSTSANYTFKGTANQVTTGLPLIVNNLTIQNNSGVTLSNNVTINGRMRLAAGLLNIADRTLVFQNNDIPIERDGTTTTGQLTTNNNTTLQFGSAGNTGGVLFTLPNNVFSATPAPVGTFVINRSNPVQLSSQDLLINSSLQLTSGILDAGSQTVIVNNGASITGGSTASHIKGNLRRSIPAGTNPSVDYPVGDGVVYAPVSFTANGSVTSAGAVTIQSIAGESVNIGTSGINQNRNVNRYWRVTENTTVTDMSSFQLGFTYSGSDNDPGTTPSEYVIRVFQTGQWYPVTVAGSPTSTNAVASAIANNRFGDFAIGNITGSITVDTHPDSLSVCVPNGASFTAVSNSVPAPSIQWQVNTGGGFTDITSPNQSPGTTYSGFNSSTLTLTGSSLDLNGAIYRAVFTNINGEVASKNGRLLVNAVVTPTATLQIVNNGGSPVICSGTSLTFRTQAGNTGGGTVNYDFRVNGVSVQSSASNEYTTAGLQNNNVVSCVVTITSGSCITTATANTDATFTSQTIQVLTPSVSLSSNLGTTICAGTSVTFTATAAQAGSFNLLYNFKVNGISRQSGSSNQFTVSNLQNNEVVTCDLTIQTGTCAGTTAVSNGLTMTVNPNLTPTVTLNASSSTICTGSTVTFTASAANTGGGTVNYDFKVNGVSRQSAASNTFTASNLTNGQVVTCEVVVTGGSCTAASATSNGITMNVASLPTVTLSASPTGSVCSGSPVTFTATAANTGGASVLYTFSVNGISMAPSASNTFTTSSLADNDQVQCQIELTSGTCSGATAVSNLLTMDVVTSFTPAVTLSVTPGTTINAGGTATFTAVASNIGGGSITYSFKVNGVTSQSGPLTVFSTNTLQNGQVVTCEISISGGTCLSSSMAVSNSITMSVTQTQYVWTGTVSTNWTTDNNWSTNDAPPAGSRILIQQGSVRYPVIGSGIVSVGNLTIENGGSLTVNGSGLLQIAGVLQNSGTMNAVQGSVEFNGSTLQTVNGNQFSSSTVKNLVISNNVTLSGLLQVTGVVSFGNVNNRTLNSAGFLVLKSSAGGKASVADLTNSNANSGNSITGLTTVEHYIPASRKWRGLSAPLKGSSNNSIFDNWQNGGVEEAGTGVLLWSPSGSGAAGNGFSLNNNPGASANIRGYSVNVFNTPSNTKTTPLFTAAGPRPYIVFVTDTYKNGLTDGFMRDQSRATTLKARGELITGNYQVSGLAAGFNMIANPYASDIDFSTIGKTNFPNQFWVWDPKIAGTNGVGGYVYTANSGSGYVSAPLFGSYNNNSTVIPAGGAFFVRVNEGQEGTVSFRETDKATGAPLLFGRTQNDENRVLRVTVKDPAASVTYDGIAAVFNATSTKEIDPADAQKFSIGSENISIRRFTRDWAIEFRPLITAADTVFLRLHNMKQQSYSLEIQGEQFATNGQLTAVLQDLFLNTETPLNLGSVQRISFAVTAATASSGDRFRIVFRQNVITSVGPDVNSAQGIQLFPNPVARGAETQVQFRNLKAGRYQFTLYALNGVRVMNEVLVHAGGTAVQKVRVASDLATGVYYAEIVNEKGWKERVKVVVE